MTKMTAFRILLHGEASLPEHHHTTAGERLGMGSHSYAITFQAYQVGLLNQGILSEDEVKQLIPDVLDSLLDFHLGLLRRLKERQAESAAVETISDIIVEEVSKLRPRAQLPGPI